MACGAPPPNRRRRKRNLLSASIFLHVPAAAPPRRQFIGVPPHHFTSNSPQLRGDHHAPRVHPPLPGQRYMRPASQTLKLHLFPSSRTTAGLTLVALSLSAAACLVDNDSAEEYHAETVAEVSSELKGEPSFDNDLTFGASRSCSFDNDCAYGCQCHEELCVQRLLAGPLPPNIDCAQPPPARHCSTAADCQHGCYCNAGLCAMGVLPGPLPPANLMPRCHLPPPDSYEADNQWYAWSPYLGTPQSHSFHTAGDSDWIAVYFGVAGNVRFSTYALTHDADTLLKVYHFDNQVKGALVAVHDDIGGWYFQPDSKSSRIDLAVAANSLYLVEVVNRSAAYVYTTRYQFPEYTLKIAYQ
ncbi:MAG TPA: hypothetical protein ENK23_01435 [Sorangium sp.]|nr:hypothetical protein [Sorangium sp.]